MSRFITILIFILLLFGCRAVKTESRTETSVVDTSELSATVGHLETATVEATVSAVVEEQEIKTVETTTVVYDTEKPVVPETGRPPVASETTVKATVVKGKQTQEVVQTVAAAAITDSTEIQARDVHHVAIKVEQSETPVKPAIAYWWYIIGTLSIIAGGYFLNKKIGLVTKIIKLFR
ncbi:MAG: hypothetical protein LBF90_00775 [Prevotellaceae bacterium]|jgi:uncharacterized protein YcfL|nr:hypothetical protein [Prevotellaceae bacterium]